MQSWDAGIHDGSQIESWSCSESAFGNAFIETGEEFPVSINIELSFRNDDDDGLGLTWNYRDDKNFWFFEINEEGGCNLFPRTTEIFIWK